MKEFTVKSNKVIVYSGGANVYYLKAVLRKFLQAGIEVSTVYTDCEASAYLGQVSVYPCSSFYEKSPINATIFISEINPFYAEQMQDKLRKYGYKNVKLPIDIGMEYTADKLSELELNLNIGCSLNCLYCPQDKIIKSYMETVDDRSKCHLTLDEFKFLLDERMNPASVLSFSGMSEPFENEDAVDMLCYAYDCGCSISINTSLMGLTYTKFSILRNHVKHFHRVVLHIPDAESHSHFSITDEYKRILNDFIEAYHNDILRFSCHGTVHAEILPIINSVDIPVHGGDASQFNDRAGNLQNMGAITKHPTGKKIVCALGPVQTHSLVMMPDGRLVRCCNDYSPNWNIGNILKQTWGEIARGEGIRQFLDELDHPCDNACWRCNSAMERGAALKHRYPEWYIYGDNFLRVKSALENGDCTNPILAKVKQAKHICIYGLGKFFADSYFASYWHTIIHADLLSDGDSKWYGKSVVGIPCVPKEQLTDYEGLLIIIYTRNDLPIRSNLNELGLTNIVNIADIMEALDRV